MPYKIKNGTIEFKTPERQKGQESMLGVACDPIETVRVALVGCGSRGNGNLGVLMQCEGVEVVALCDLYGDHVKNVQKTVIAAGRHEAREYVGAEAYKEVCECEDIDLVYICTGWQMHTPIALYALNHGKHVACEVPSATSLKECWDLVNASEINRRHCIILENCCYGDFEMMGLNMAQQGLLGEVIYGEGAYIHHLTNAWPHYTDNWRMDFNVKHSGDNYPTHGLGPVCQAMNVNRGDRLDYLVAMGTKSVDGIDQANNVMNMGIDEMAEGDYVQTLIHTLNGHQILLRHDVYTDVSYSREYELFGTKAKLRQYPKKMAFMNISSEQLPQDIEAFQGFKDHGINIDQIRYPEFHAALAEYYKHPIVREYEEMAKIVGGHGGMDYVLNARMIYCLRNGLPVDIDVYDLAAWCAPVELSAISIDSGSMPVRIPDFTRGDWNKYDKLTFAYKK